MRRGLSGSALRDAAAETVLAKPAGAIAVTGVMRDRRPHGDRRRRDDRRQRRRDCLRLGSPLREPPAASTGSSPRRPPQLLALLIFRSAGRDVSNTGRAAKNAARSSGKIERTRAVLVHC